MLAQDRHEGSNPASQSTSKRNSKHTAKFLFIDSSNGGVNAKPDRVVRSFVMKSARNRKSWSTRPKSPKEEDHAETRTRRKTSLQANVPHDHTFAVGTTSSRDYRRDSFWDGQSLTSSRSGSIFSTFSSRRTCDSPSSSYASPSAEHGYSEYNRLIKQEPDWTLCEGFRLGSFDCLSVHLDVYTRRLLHQFIEGSAPRLIPVDLHKSSTFAATDWIARCIQSPGGAPYIYAALTASARAAGLSSEVYKWKAVSEVNKLLSDPRTSIDDTTIATVLVLLALEESDLADPRRKGRDREWSLSASDAHLKGLRTMIGQRGGLAALYANRCLQVFILMHSIAQSITTFKRPYALLLDHMGQIENYALHSQNSTPRKFLPTAVLNIDIESELFDIVYCIHLFSSDLTKWYNSGHVVHSLDSIELQKHACLLTYRLFDWYQLGEESELAGLPGRNPIDQIVCLAYLIYLIVATEPTAQSWELRLSNIINKLRQALQRVPILVWANMPELLLWSLTMGAFAARDLPQSQQSHASDFSFFVHHSQLTFALHGHSGYTTADHLLGRIEQYPWISSIFDTRARRLWARMGLCRSSIVDMNESSSEEDEIVVADEHAVGQSTTARFFPALKSGSKGGKTEPE